MIRTDLTISAEQLKKLDPFKVDGYIRLYAGTQPSTLRTPPMIRTNVHLPAPLLAKLRKLAKATGLSVAELIRRACDAYVKENK